MADEKKLQKGDKAIQPRGAGDVDMTWFRLIGMDHSYVDAFKDAADRLVTTQKGSPYPEGVVIAIGYLYRHYLELHLKYVLIEARAAGVATFTDKMLQREHGLVPLWNRARPPIESDGAKVDADALSITEAIIQEIHNVDPTAQEFRYARTTANKESLVRMPSQFSLQRLTEAINEVHKFLDEHRLVFTCMSDSNG